MAMITLPSTQRARRPIAGSQTGDGGMRSASVAGAATSSGCGSATSAGEG